MNPKDIISQKVEDFAKNEKAYKSKDFQETEARNRFIDPLFEALGWNLNQTNIPKKLWDVHREYSQKDNSSTKKPDYAFRLDAKLKFFVEAKAPHVPLTDKDPVFQAKRYAYSTNGKAPIIILTDFEEFRVFNALQKPNYDNPLQGVLKEFDFKYVDYLDKWDLLVENFSREAVLSGSLDRLRGKISKSTKKLDDEFLDEMVTWRENLAKHIAIKNESLSVDELNEAVQRILDRLIFIRQLEDRNIVEENTLLGYAKKENLYKVILPFFGELNGKYNGLLFKPHFSEKLQIEDKVLKETILDLCYPRSPFQFDVIEPEILGRIYERFLGSKIRLTDSHRAKIEEKPEVRHAGGVYYTPEYIVNYIVKETIGKKTENKTPEEISKIKILDPACGSGSFLLGAYQYLMEWHIDYYKSKVIVHKPEANGIKKASIHNRGVNPSVSDDFFFDAEGEIKLSTKKKGEILVNNIYGVDIDREATEVAILSLYLKLLEDGIDDDGFLFLKGKVLPDMTNNIKCGNSLVDNKIKKQFPDLPFKEIREMSSFDWEVEYKEIFTNNGFDCIIGNPPYLRIQGLQEHHKEQIEFYLKNYLSAVKRFDFYLLFMERGFGLLKEEGLLGFICPHKFINSDFGSGLRKYLLENTALKRIISFGNNLIFENATTYTGIFLLEKSNHTEFEYYEFKDTKVEAIKEYLLTEDSGYAIYNFNTLTESPWTFSDNKTSIILNKLNQLKTKLGDVFEEISVGVQTGIDEVHLLKYISKNGNIIKVFSEKEGENIEIESGLLKPFLLGEDVHRYKKSEFKYYCLYPYQLINGKTKILEEKEFMQLYPKGFEYVSRHKKYLKDIRTRQKTNPKYWYSCHRQKDMNLFERKRIITPYISLGCNMTIIDSGIYNNTKVYSLEAKQSHNENMLYWLGILNSRILWWFISNTGYVLRGGYYAFTKDYLSPFPIPIINFSKPNEVKVHDRIVQLVSELLELYKESNTNKSQSEKDKLVRYINDYEAEIDEIVFKLYELTPEEIKIVEGNTK